MARKTNYIDATGNERYRMQRKVGYRHNKKGELVPYIKSFYGLSKHEAEQKYIDFMMANKPGKPKKQYLCLSQAIDEWKECVFLKSDNSNATKKKYISAYNRLFRESIVAGLPIETVTPLDIQNIYNKIDECYSTKRALHNFLRQFFKYAEMNGICNDITRTLVVPSDPRRSPSDTIEVWDNKDVEKIIAELKGTTLRLLIVLAVNTGARFAELLALTYDDIRDNMLYINKQLYEISAVDDEDDVVLHMEPVKTESSNRVIPLSESVLEEIEAHKKVQKRDMRKNHYDCKNYLFTTSNGTLYYKRNVTRSLKRLYKRIGVPYHKFHAYRHTFGTNLSEAGVPIEVTSKLMGHSSIEITAKYYINIDAQRRLDAVDKIAELTLGNKS